MIARGVTGEQVRAAARAAGVTADIRDTWNKRTGPGVRFGLRLGDPVNVATAKRGRPKYRYQRTSTTMRRANGDPRRIGAVCWHGHRDFFRALFAANPDAKVRTMQTERTVPGKYYTAANFEDVYGRTGTVNAGSIMRPMMYEDACVCGDSDRGDRIKTVPASKGVTFGTLTPEGLTNVRVLDRASISACPFTIFVADHYRPDGTCKCDDPDERARMMRDWDYTPEDFVRAGVTA